MKRSRKAKVKAPATRNSVALVMVRRHPRGGSMRHRADRRPKDAARSWRKDWE